MLAEAEGAASSFRIAQLIEQPLPGAYDLPHLQYHHWWIFQDVYAWAGRLRSVRIGKGQLFCLPEDLESAGEDVFGRLAAADRLRGLGRKEFVDGLTGFLAEVNSMHPFREGNGRSQRAFFRALAAEAGWHLDWSFVDPERNRRAGRSAHESDTTALRDLVDEVVAPLR